MSRNQYFSSLIIVLEINDIRVSMLTLNDARFYSRCLKRRLFLKMVSANSYRKQFAFFQAQIAKGAKSNILCKLCARKLFFKKSPQIPSSTNNERGKIQHFGVQTLMHSY